jgi:hypothetical protein
MTAAAAASDASIESGIQYGSRYPECEI